MSQPAGSRKKRPAKKSGTPSGNQPEVAGKTREEAPEPIWGKFPLVPIAVLIGIILLFLGLFSGNKVQMAIGLGLACLGGLEQVVREHFAGYRSHTSLLAGLVFVITVGLLYFWALWILWQCLLAGAILAAGAAWLFLKQFEKASGGLRYRVR